MFYSIHPKDVYRFLRDEAGAQFIQFIPIVERKNRTGYQEGHKVTDRSVTAKQYGDFLIGVFDEWIRRDVGSVFVQLFDVALAAWVGQQPGLNYLCKGYKAFFHYIDKPMRVMTKLIKERRPPADVMFILASENR